MTTQNNNPYLTAQQYWRTVVDKESAISSEQLQIQIEGHKRLLNIFQPGNYYYLLFDIYNGEIVNVSDEVIDVLGYKAGEINMPLFMENIHPDDKPYFLSFEAGIASFFSAIPVSEYKKYKMQYDLRIKKKENQYCRILIQYVLIHYDEQNIYNSFHIHTDISHIKQQGPPCFSIIGLDGAPSYYNIQRTDVLAPSYNLFTRREREILKMVIENKTSRQIADELFISIYTVNAHRRNIMGKALVKTPLELVSKSIHEGWI